MKINCIIVDDEPLARQGIKKYSEQTGFLNVVALCKNAKEAQKILSENKSDSYRIDLIFLDIQMPGISGIDFLKTLYDPPTTILTTANPNYAIEGYSLNVLDYLLKPFSFERFKKAAIKAQKHIQLRSESNNTPDYIFIKTDSKLEKVFLNEILYIEGMQNYVIVHTLTNKLVTYLTMKMAEEQFSHKGFIRVHKSFIVLANAVERIEKGNLIIHNRKIPIGRKFKKNLTGRILAK